MPLTPDGDLCERWRQLMARYHDVSCALERALSQQHELGVSEFETLDLLVKSPYGKQFVHELHAGIHLSQSALSRTVARLEKRGLVTRAMCTNDRRAVSVTPTEEGRRLHAEAAPTHAAVLADHLGELQPQA